MTDTPSTDAPEPSPSSPYGPAEGIEDLFATPDASAAEAAESQPDAPTVSAGDSAAITRTRRTLKRLAVTLPLVGLGLSVAAIVVYLSAGGSIFGVDPLSEIAGLLLTFVGPTLVVLGLHMVVWRAMVRPLSRMTPGSRTGTIIGVGAALSFVSVILVFILVFAGFMLVSLLLAATDQAL